MSIQLLSNNSIEFFNDLNAEFLPDAILVSHIQPDVYSIGPLHACEISSGGHITSSIDIRPTINVITQNLCNKCLNGSSEVEIKKQEFESRLSQLL